MKHLGIATVIAALFTASTALAPDPIVVVDCTFRRCVFVPYAENPIEPTATLTTQPPTPEPPKPTP